MLSSPFSPWRSVLTPRDALDLANAQLRNAANERKANNSKKDLLSFYDDAERALSRIKGSVKKDLISSSRSEDQALRNEIAGTYIEIGEIMGSLGYPSKSQSIYKAAEEWGGHVRLTSQSSTHSRSVTSPPVTLPSGTDPIAHSIADQAIDSATNPATNPASNLVADASAVRILSHRLPHPTQDNPSGNIVPIPSQIFEKDMYQPPDINELPRVQGRLSSVAQLVHSLDLLRSSQSSEELLGQLERTWLNEIEQDADEQGRLKGLATNLIREFIHDELYGARTVAEVTSIVPVLEKHDLQRLLQLLFDGIEKSRLLNFNLLEGLAQLVQSATPGYLNADDLVKILELTSERLKDTHSQSADYIIQLTLTVSHVLDAMADSKVKGLDRKDLHAPFAAYLRGLASETDPYLIYQAAYAYQASLYVPDDETPLRATLRRSGKVVKGVSGLVSDVKGLDLNQFVDSLYHIQEGLAEASEVSTLVKTPYDDVTTLAKSGKEFWDSLNEGLSFSRKRAWYPALRGADVLLQNGQLVNFERFVREAPCRRDPAFQWGICQRLGEMAANPECDDESRKSAVTFLGEMYQDDTVWGQQANIKKLIVSILLQLAAQSGSTMQAAITLLQDLEKNGDAKKQELYRSCQDENPRSHPLKATSAPTLSLSLLDRAQNKVDVEGSLRELKDRRIKGRDKALYISPQAKGNLKARDDQLFPLMDRVKEFLGSERKVFLLLGDSGAGKSTFNLELERDLWSTYKKQDGPIPLFITLAAIRNPEQDLISKHLQSEGFKEEQIRELKRYREFILICDGYDESRQMDNLYMKNRLNQYGEWRSQMVIGCRSEYLGSDYRAIFQPGDRNHQGESPLFQEAAIAPFSKEQIVDYVEQFVSMKRPPWKVEDYLKALNRIHGLKDLVTNPFLLTLSLEVLPQMVDPEQTLSAARMTMVALYDQFVEQWLERGRLRLLENVSTQDRKTIASLSDGSFTQQGIQFLKNLATAVYEKQEGISVVEYSSFWDRGSWKDEFFSQESETSLIRDACPLTRSGNQYRFLHQSLLEYSLSRAVFEPHSGGNDESSTLEPTTMASRRQSISSNSSLDSEDDSQEVVNTLEQPILDSVLGRKNFVGESSILRFLVERVQQGSLFKRQLLAVIERSKVEKKELSAVRKAAANAITILVRAGVQFNGVDLRGIQIPGANLSHGVFEHAKLQEANMKRVILRSVSLRGANLSGAQMKGVQFGELPFLKESSKLLSCAYSPDGNTFAVGLDNGDMSIYTTSKWEKSKTLVGHTKQVSVVTYSSTSERIASGSSDNTVRLWDIETGECLHILSGHSGSVSSIVFSPTGDQIASASRDKTIRLWDVKTGNCHHTLSGHEHWVSSVAYSPKGDQIASGGWDNTVRFWDTETGDCCQTLSGHSECVSSVVYSPHGDQIVSGSWDATVRLWDVRTGDCLHVLNGHTGSIWNVLYSPKGDQIASVSRDTTVRLWDVRTGDSHHILSGHSNSVLCIAYSPNGDQIVSGSKDSTVRLWDVATGDCLHTLGGHTDAVSCVAYSPRGYQIASGSSDNTVRLWDVEKAPTHHMPITHSGRVSGVAFSPSGGQFASGGYNTTRLWDVETGECRHTLGGHRGTVCAVAYSPNGNRIVSTSVDTTLRLWDVETGDCLHILKGHGEVVWMVAYSPKGDRIASGSMDKTIRLWDVATGNCLHVFRGHSMEVWGVAYSPKGDYIASGSDDKTLRLWDVETGNCHRTMIGHSDRVSSIAYSPKGDKIVTGSYDKTVRLWDVETGDCCYTLSGHNDVVCSVAYSPKGNQITSGSDDHTARIWDVASGQCRAVIQNYAWVDSIAWRVSDDDNFLLTGCADGIIRLWRIDDEEDECCVKLHWRSPSSELTLVEASIQDAQGLSGLNIQLLEQRGAIGKAITSDSA